MLVLRPSSTSWSIPARVGPTEVEPSYQRNRLQTSRNQQSWTSELVDGAFQINSSTFGTLLSSQGSSAHRSPAFRPRRGATWSNLPVGSWPVKLAWTLSGPRAPLSDRLEMRPPKRALVPPRLRKKWGGVPPGAGRPARGLASRRSLATSETLRAAPGRVKSDKRGPSHSIRRGTTRSSGRVERDVEPLSAKASCSSAPSSASSRATPSAPSTASA